MAIVDGMRGSGGGLVINSTCLNVLMSRRLSY